MLLVSYPGTLDVDQGIYPAAVTLTLSSVPITFKYRSGLLLTGVVMTS